METRISLVRHGVTAWNYAGRVQGRSDIPLVPEGERLYGCIDLTVVLSDYEHVRPVLIQRLQKRYPAVPFTVLSN